MICTPSGERSVPRAARIAPSTSSGRKCVASTASFATASVMAAASISRMATVLPHAPHARAASNSSRWGEGTARRSQPHPLTRSD
jgi:hypothetical protein